MSTFTVHLVHQVSTTVTVEAENVDSAIDSALYNAPSPLNSSNNGIDPAGDWQEAAVYDETGAEVWTPTEDKPEPARLSKVERQRNKLAGICGVDLSELAGEEWDL